MRTKEGLILNIPEDIGFWQKPFWHFLRRLITVKLPEEFSELAAVLTPREEQKLNDWELGYWCYPEHDDKPRGMIFRAGFALDICMRNHAISPRRRKEIVRRYYSTLEEEFGIILRKDAVSER